MLHCGPRPPACKLRAVCNLFSMRPSPCLMPSMVFSVVCFSATSRSTRFLLLSQPLCARPRFLPLSPSTYYFIMGMRFVNLPRRQGRTPRRKPRLTTYKTGIIPFLCPYLDKNVSERKFRWVKTLKGYKFINQVLIQQCGNLRTIYQNRFFVVEK